MRYRLIAVFTLVVLFVVTTAFAEGLLPSLTETVGIAMPSLGEALSRYPDSETENGDGSITEFYSNVSESDFNAFSVYLQQQEAELADYKAEKGVLTAEIRAKGAAFSLNYDSKKCEARVTYPSGTFDEQTKNAKTHFDAAQKLLAEGKTDDAYAEIFAIPQFMKYGPVDRLMKEDENFAIAAAREVKYMPYKEVGRIVTFGTYPQTTEGTDQTPIEWIVLDYDETNHKALLLSKYGLDAVPYNKKFTDITWEKCTLRTWLNGEFLKRAFSAKERSAILVTNVDNSSVQGYSKWNMNDENNTQDQVFLLSYAEAKHYLGAEYNFRDNTKARVAPTAYAIAQGADKNSSNQTADGESAGSWWLRSPGEYQDRAADVNSYGWVNSCFVQYDEAVRPALWLDLNVDIF